MTSTLELSGTAFVTGAAQIGEAVARQFAQEGCCAVTLADFAEDGLACVAQDLPTIATNPNFQVFTFNVDVREKSQCQAAIAFAAEKMGRVDYAVNSAGITRPRCKIDEYPEKDYTDVMGINLDGVYNCVQAQIQQMLQQDPLISRHHANCNLPGERGSIVNISSICGLVGLSSAAPYVAAKHGVIGLTKTAAIEYGEQLIRVNAICPGFILTPMIKTPVQFAALQRIADVYTPLKRSGVADEIASTVLFQCSPRSSFVNGAAWPVDGGYTTL